MELMFSENTSLYFYSALLQANAAIIALVGLYSIYKIQAAQSAIESIKSYFMIDGRPINQNLGTMFDNMNIQQKYEHVKEHNTINIDNRFLKKWLENEQIIVSVKNGIKCPSIIMAIALVINATMILFSFVLHISYPILELILAFLILSYEIFLIILVSWRIIAIARM